MRKQILCIIVFSFLFSSCAGVPAMQARIRRIAAKGDFDYAAQILSRSPENSYGTKHRLLEALDRGMIFHYAGRYHESIKAFEEAKRIYDELYTKSLSMIAASWLWNDASLPYPGEDFERAMANVFQALNFIAIGEYDEALVEARNANSVLQLINDRYPADKKNVYREDAFVRMLMGILYESAGNRQDLNDAFISYKKAYDIYEKDFKPNYSLPAPEILKENFLASAQWMGEQEFRFYQKQFADTALHSLDARQDMAEVYVVLYCGQIINKVEGTIVLPGMDGLLTRISFPKYRKSFRSARSMTVDAESNGVRSGILLEKAQDLDAIARKNLEDRKIRIFAKAIARPIAKQFMVEAAEDVVRDKAGQDAGSLFNYAGNVYLLYSEEADLRSWETLPSEIYIGRLLINPGTYKFFLDDQLIKEFSVNAGDKKFIMHWAGY